MRPITLLSLLLLAIPTLAAEPSDASIDALLKANHLPESITAMVGSAGQFARQTIADSVKGKDLNDKQKAELDKVAETFSARVKTELTFAKIEPLYTKVYKESFTQEEVSGLIAFLNSPAGAAYLKKMPQVQQKAAEANRSLMVPLMKQLQADIGQVLGK